MIEFISITYALFGLIVILVLGKPEKLQQDWLFILLMSVLGAGLYAPFAVTWPLLFSALNSILLVSGPCLLLYTRSALGRTMVRTDLYHAIPPLVLALTYTFLQQVPELLLAIIKVFYLTTYLIIAIAVYKKAMPLRSPNKRTLWFYLLFAGLATLCLVGAISVIQALLNTTPNWLVSEVIMMPVTMVFLFVLAYTGVRYHGPFGEYAQAGQYHLKSRPASVDDKAVFKAIYSDFCSLLVEKRPHLDPDFSLKETAEIFGINAQLLSKALNENFEGGFSELVAQARLQHFKTLLRDPVFNDHSLLDLGLRAGFQSKSTFNRIVKTQTGLTPSQLKVKLA